MFSARRTIAVALAALPSAQGADTLDVSAQLVGTPVLVCQIDLGQLQGELARLSWAPNGLSMHVQTKDTRNHSYDYIVDLGNREISRAFGEPAWAAEYWMQKSSLTAPGVSTLKLEVIESNRRTRPAPFTGGFANGGAQTVDLKNPVDAYEHEVTLKFVGESIGNWINDAPMAGETFGWGPPGSGALVYADSSGRLMFIDHARRKLAVAGVKDAILPAWSTDGRRLAYLQKTARRKFRLMIAAIE
jgi:hypothetical protein